MRVTYYPRKSKKGTIWYYRIIEDDGARSSGKTTHQKTKSAAKTYVTELIKRGQLQTKKSLKFKDYVNDWWVWDKCRYVRGNIARGSKISRIYVDNNRSFLKRHILPYFGEKRLSAIAVKMIEDWQMSLLGKKGKHGKLLSPTSINHFLLTLRIIFKEALRIGDLSYNPAAAVKPLKENRKVKSFLTLPEIKELFYKDKIQEIWDGDLKHYTITRLWPFL